MTLYFCNDCNMVFEEPTTINRIHHEFDVPIPEPVYLCPFCHSDDYEPLEQCCGTCEYWDAPGCYCQEHADYTDACDSCKDWEFHLSEE